MRKVILTISILLLLVSNAFAQSDTDKSNATLKETLDWISGKLSKNYQFGMYFDNGYSITGFEPVNFNGCQLIWRINSTQRKEGAKDEIGVTEFKVNLGDLEPTKTKTEKFNFSNFGIWYVTFYTFNNKRVVSRTLTKNRVQDRTRMRDTFTFNFKETDIDVARRMVKAFSHAIALCGGKKEVF